MRLSRLFSMTLIVGISTGATIIACSSGGGGKNVTPDAKVFKDAPGQPMDAPAGGGVSGLGQKCGSGQPACPSTSPDCIALGKAGGAATTSYCTPHCDDNATSTTDGSGNFTTFTPPRNMNCTTQYSGSTGSGACGVILAYTPMDNPKKPNMQYTAISLGCVVLCGTGNACPTGMTADTADFGTCICFPS